MLDMSASGNYYPEKCLSKEEGIRARSELIFEERMTMKLIVNVYYNGARCVLSSFNHKRLLLRSRIDLRVFMNTG
ncbi:MAG TPA: hypothetical protein DEA91_12685 [Paenibacillus sp.]|nr:hypothetical protein [Paenibacillus sp.]